MPKYAEEILAAVTELQRHPTAEPVSYTHLVGYGKGTDLQGTAGGGII